MNLINPHSLSISPQSPRWRQLKYLKNQQWEESLCIGHIHPVSQFEGLFTYIVYGKNVFWALAAVPSVATGKKKISIHF